MADTDRTMGVQSRGSDRRGHDRRVCDEPFDGADRRVGQRRSGTDRRTEARTRLQP